MSGTIRSLDEVAVLAELPPDELEGLARRCNWMDYDHHEEIIGRDTDSRDVFFVVSGRVRVVNYSYSGREVSYDDIGQGGFFGELAAIDGEPRSATVVTLDRTTVAILSPAMFGELLERSPDFARAVMVRLVKIIRGSTDRIMDLSTRGAPTRIYAELLRLARPGRSADGGALIHPVPVHADIASRAGTTRETVARALSDLSRRDLVHREGDTLRIASLEALEDLVESGDEH